MSTTTQPASSPYLPVRDDWLARRTEAILEPDLPIVDPHHHLWERPGWVYMLDDLLADTNSGHNIVATVFVQCRSMHRADGPEEMKPVGETEFVNGVAAMSASGVYGKTKICAGIVGHADLRLGARVRPVLEAHIRAGGGRFRGIRHITAWDADPTLMNPAYAPPPGLLADATFREGFSCLAPLNLSFDAWLYHPQIDELTALAQAFPDTRICLNHVGGPLAIGVYAGKRDEVFSEMVGVDPRTGEVSQRGGEARRHGDAHQRLRLPRGSRSAFVGDAGRRLEAIRRNVHRGVRRVSAACSRATSRWTRVRTPTRRTGMRARFCRAGRVRRRRATCSAAPRRGSTGWSCSRHRERVGTAGLVVTGPVGGAAAV